MASGKVGPNWEIIIEPPRGFVFREAFAALTRLLVGLARRQIATEYGGMYLGLAWVAARPLLMTAVFIFLKNASSLRPGLDMPYVPYLYSGLILWFFFVDSVMDGAQGLRRDAGLIKKIHYPHLLSVLAPVTVNAYGLLVALIPLVAMMAWYGIAPTPILILLPLVLLQVVVLILALAPVFAVLFVISKDLERVMQLVFYVGLFLSPVIYFPSMFNGIAQTVYMANPLAGPLLAFRSVLFVSVEFPWLAFLYSAALTAFLFLIGLALFQRLEREVLDRL
jgi:homopolymeric O-antigen transport system permease protein